MRAGLISTIIGAVMASTALSGAAAQDWGRPEGYADRRVEVGAVVYNGGRFEYQGRGRWVEYGPGATVKANFNELSRSADWIDLDDPSRDVQIRLNIRARAILITERGGPYRPLYPIQSIDTARAPVRSPFGRPFGGESMGYREGGAPVEREIEAGSWLVNQFDAQRICPSVAVRAGGQWTGAFRTTRPTVMSVCTVRFVR